MLSPPFSVRVCSRILYDQRGSLSDPLKSSRYSENRSKMFQTKFKMEASEMTELVQVLCHGKRYRTLFIYLRSENSLQ